ncbi:MAG: beta-glucanase/beta-glucan synthetase [Hyphomicrobiales bacterium]|nr:beta-glucanase/beta-glucan synthetase [Hyphomicrobiales bacterium]
MPINPGDLAGTANLTFSDEFNTLSLWNGQGGKWSTSDSWDNKAGYTLSGNGEQQWYLNDQYAPTQAVKPWTVSNGVLDITASAATPDMKPLIHDQNYTSGQINTFHSFSQTYGYFEMKAELPSGAGLWPAFWLLPKDQSWPPEIDVMEQLGQDPNKFYATVHSAASGDHTQVSTPVSTTDLTSGFHTYGVDWEADNITWYLDGKQVCEAATPTDLHSPMYMIANLAVGGYWPGSPTSAGDFPATMQVDYIHAYSAKPDGAATGPTQSGPVQAADAAALPDSQPIVQTQDPVSAPASTAIPEPVAAIGPAIPATTPSLSVPSAELAAPASSAEGDRFRFAGPADTHDRHIGHAVDGQAYLDMTSLIRSAGRHGGADTSAAQTDQGQSGHDHFDFSPDGWGGTGANHAQQSASHHHADVWSL